MGSRKHLQKVVACYSGLLVLFLSFFILPQARGQVAGATLSGTVTDSSGAVIAGAQVSIRDVNTGVTRTVTSSASGFYTAPNLQPATYEIITTAPGFATSVRSGLMLTVGAQQVSNITMQVGEVTQKVEVTTEAPTVELASSSISGLVNESTVRELPLNGRDWTQLATLQPGVTAMGSLQISSNNFQRGNRGFGTQLAISGSRPQQNNFRIDGISVNDYVNSGPGSVLGVALGADAIAEFSVISSNYSAEYGRTSGGVVNAITRSGSNQFHGSAYWFLRDEDFDARNFFDKVIPPFHRNQFGASGGGPIRKDHTFVFADYEGLRQDLGFTNPNTVPSQDARNGLLNFANSTAFPSGCVGNGVSGTINGNSYVQCALTVDSLVKPYLPFWGLPNAGLSGLGNTGVYTVTTQRVTAENFVSARIDHKFSDRDSLFGTYQYDKAPATQPDSLNNVLMSSISGRQDVIIEETHTFSPSVVNSFRVGFNRSTAKNAFGVNAINPPAGDLNLGLDHKSAAPSLIVSGLATVGGGVVTSPSTVYYFNEFQGYDDAFVTKGIHSLKIGFAVERIQEHLAQNFGVIGGQYRFGSLPALLTNQPTSLRANISTVFAPRYLRQSVFGGYAQDDIRLKSNLTVNLGLRYEMSTVPTETQGKLATLRNPYTDITPHLGDPYFYNPTLRNFDPRVGFAWDPFRTGKTSIRGGFGIFDVLPLTYEYAIMAVGSAPFVLTGNASPLAQGTFPYLAYSSLTTAANGVRVSYVEPYPKRNYVMQWNLSVQHEFAPNFAATIAFVGNRGVHQPFRGDDIDMVVPTATPGAGYLWPLPVGTGTKLNPNVGRIDILAWRNNSFFDALEFQVVKKMSHGFQVQGSYTWSKSIDEGSGSTHGDPFGNSISADWFFDSKLLDRGLSDFNIQQNLVINYTWLIPSPKSGIAAWTLGGWQLGGIFVVNSGLPFTPLMAPDPYGTRSTLSYAFPNRIEGSGCESAVNPGNPNQYIKPACFALPTAPASFAAQCAPFTKAAAPAPSGSVYCANLLGNVGRNSLIGPGMMNFDFSLFKNIPIKRISESFNVQFRVEAFNVFNHPNFVAPLDNLMAFDATGAKISSVGLIDATSTTSRQLQFAMKLVW
jgi:hypothetical protein